MPTQKCKYQYRIITKEDFSDLTHTNYQTEKWYMKNINRLTQIYHWSQELHAIVFFGWMLPKGMRFPQKPRLALAKAKEQLKLPLGVAITNKKAIETKNVLRDMLN